jgi:hypothetical protein
MPISPSRTPGIHRPGVLSTDDEALDEGALDVNGRSCGIEQKTKRNCWTCKTIKPYNKIFNH